MAGPITHIILTDTVYKDYFSKKDKKLFYIGTSFPDIRYLGIIDRSRTHFLNPSLDEIYQDESFLAGVKFHSYLDELREKFIISKNLYTYFPKSTYTTQAAKFLEDTYLYQKFNMDQWVEISSYFDEVLPQEIAFGIKTTNVHQWHSTLQKYFKGIRTKKDIYNFVSSINRPKEMADEIDLIIKKMKTNKNIVAITEELYQKFPKLVAQMC